MNVAVAIILLPVAFVVLFAPAFIVWKFADAVAFRITKTEASDNPLLAGVLFCVFMVGLAFWIGATHRGQINSSDYYTEWSFWTALYCLVMGGGALVLGTVSGAAALLSYAGTALLHLIRGDYQEWIAEAKRQEQLAQRFLESSATPIGASKGES